EGFLTYSPDQSLKGLVAHAHAHAPANKQLVVDAGVRPEGTESPPDLPNIPVTHKDRLEQIHAANPPCGRFLTVRTATLPRTYIPPGPIFGPQPPHDDMESQLAPFRYVGFGRGDKVLNTFMYHLSPAGLLLDEALRGCGATVLPTGPGNTELQIMMALRL